ncbi:hypothetical protein ACI2K4_01995 [Micromonospora sp. NPDC050397]|uniref:hypothetical protein n=1 Tax=Micromonospora sp. NPDC050397 TaxID=3364279 RepID=UPI003851266B
MSKMDVSNESGRKLGLWVEPWGADYWLRPGETLTVVADTAAEQTPFNVVMHDQGVTVWVNSASAAEVLDKDDKPVPFGHQRPTSVTS